MTDVIEINILTKIKEINKISNTCFCRHSRFANVSYLLFFVIIVMHVTFISLQGYLQTFGDNRSELNTPRCVRILRILNISIIFFQIMETVNEIVKRRVW